MPLTYTDAYLVRFCDAATEARAYADVDALGTFPPAWRDKLALLRTYILVCLDHQAEPEDLFTAKLKAYRAEFDATLIHARKAAAIAGGDTMPPIFAIPIERA